jgi:hypothetical protein
MGAVVAVGSTSLDAISYVLSDIIAMSSMLFAVVYKASDAV